MKNKNVKYLLIALIIICVVCLFVLLRNLGFTDIGFIEDFVLGFGMFAPIMFILIYVIVTLFGVSAVVFTILAGTIFGLWVGWILVIVAATISATIAFIISRYFREFFSKYQKKSKGKNVVSSLTKRIENNAKKNGFTTIAILRLSFLPYIPLSYAAGLVKSLKLRDFALATFLTNIFGSFFFIFLGFSITQSLPYFILAIVLVIVFSQLPKIIKKIKEK